MPPKQEPAGRFAVVNRKLGARWQLHVRNLRLGVQQPQGRQVLRRRPQDRIADVELERAAGRGQLVEPVEPIPDHRFGDGHQAEQRVVHLLGVAGVRPGFLGDPRDGVGVQRAQVSRALGQRPTQAHGSRAAFLDRRVVEVGVGLAAHDLMRHRRGLDGVPGVQPDLTRLDALQDANQLRQVHRLGEAVLHRLLDQGMVRHLQGAGDVLLAAHLLGEHGGQQIVRSHALEIGRHALPAALPSHRQRTRDVPAPAGREQRHVENRLLERFRDIDRGDVAKGLLEGKRVLRTQRKQDRVVVGRRLQLEVEAHAKPLAQRQPPGAVDPLPERRVHHQLHAARVVEESLVDHVAV